jgi:DNA-binding transcriptional LysR family regulator
MIAELEALVAVSKCGSMERAAGELYLTPSALTRRIQRLESALGAVLLDRNFKPPKLTRVGGEVLEKSRAILSGVSELKARAIGDAVPAGTFRLGLSHALARPEISGAVIELGKRFPLLQPTISSDVSCSMLTRLRAGELDCALMVFPSDMKLPNDLEGVMLAEESMQVVQARARARRGRGAKGEEFYRRSWVLNPEGCMVRAEVESRVQALGARLMVAAELHNPDLQVALIAGDVGVGILRRSYVQAHRARLSVIEHPDFRISIRIGLFRGQHLGAREKAVVELGGILRKHFGGTGES